ncbi:DUF6088 family protein [Litoribacterium kuwaitense]|uniref:DUF6088 family protein n=1 Tax=Litoribacterium kuwaitense TaxID=1398745 RepID=UPI0035E45561
MNVEFLSPCFLVIGNYEAVNRALSRLNNEGKLTRVLRGLYQTPNYNTFLKKILGLLQIK